MRVQNLFIDGFKSYSRRCEIDDWDPQFNAITGLNGSGKSNVLDAICFVLGITSMSTVRADKQQDLIYKRGQAGITKASVTITFDNTDRNRSPFGYEDFPTITVTRQVVLGGSSKYLVNGRRAQQRDVQSLFQSVQLNINNPNFLIMQGQITKVVNMKPQEILGLIEEASGTRMFEERREKAEKDLEKKDTKVAQIRQLLLEEIEPKLATLRKERSEFLEFQEIQTMVERNEKLIVAWDYLALQNELNALLEQKQAAEVQVQTLGAQQHEAKLRCEQIESSLIELRQTTESSEMAVSLEQDLQHQQEEYARLQTSFDGSNESLRETEQRIKSLVQEREFFERDLSTKEHDSRKFREEFHSLSSRLEQCQAELRQRRDLLVSLETGLSTSVESESGFAQATKRAREGVLTAEDRIRTLEREKSELETSQSNKLTLENELNQVSSDLHKRKSEIKTIEASLPSDSASSEAFHKLKQEANNVERQIQQLEHDREIILTSESRLELPPLGNVPRQEVFGRVASLFRVKTEHRNKMVALEVCAAHQLWDLVVTSDAIGSQILQQAQRRLTVLPLNQMYKHRRDGENFPVNKIPGAWMAVTLLDFDKKFRPIMDYVFGNHIICETQELAMEMCNKHRLKAVTFEGDVFDPQGTVSGGSSNNHGGEEKLAVVERFVGVCEKLQSISGLRKSMQAQLLEANGHMESARRITEELAIKCHEAEAIEERGEVLKGQLKSIEGKKNDIKRLDVEISQATALLSKARDLLTQTEREGDEFQQNKSGKLDEIRADIARREKEIKSLQMEYDKQERQHTEIEIDIAGSRERKEQLSNEERDANLLLNELKGSVTRCQAEMSQTQTIIAELEGRLEVEQQRLSKHNQEISKMEQSITSTKAAVTEFELQAKRSQQSLQETDEQIKHQRLMFEQIVKNNEWVADEKSQFGQSNGPYDFNRVDILSVKSQLGGSRERLSELSQNVNFRVVAMIERLEKQEAELQPKVMKIEHDRRKIKETIATLNEHKSAAQEQTWHNVSEELGNILGDLLPGASAELAMAGKFLADGLTVRVRLGQTWKDSLNELSGGQRSLVALSLILALLQYRPAPMYILDEIDAALDAHHTQNIGHVIRTRFNFAQFIVVSLKDGMYSNANQVFQARFENGSSTVRSVKSKRT